MFFIVSLALCSAAAASVSTVDLVRVKNGNVEEALYYYEKNWKAYREAALERGYIEDYRLLVDARNPGAETILLVTVYETAEQYALREENFARIMPSDGPRLLNDTQPGAFREVEDLGVFTSD